MPHLISIIDPKNLNVVKRIGMVHEKDALFHGFNVGVFSIQNPQFILPEDIYEHYKGRRYEILTIAQQRETTEYLVVYQALHGEKKSGVARFETLKKAS